MLHPGKLQTALSRSRLREALLISLAALEAVYLLGIALRARLIFFAYFADRFATFAVTLFDFVAMRVENLTAKVAKNSAKIAKNLKRRLPFRSKRWVRYNHRSPASRENTYETCSIASALDARLENGSPDTEITGVAGIKDAGPGTAYLRGQSQVCRSGAERPGLPR